MKEGCQTLKISEAGNGLIKTTQLQTCATIQKKKCNSKSGDFVPEATAMGVKGCIETEPVDPEGGVTDTEARDSKSTEDYSWGLETQRDLICCVSKARKTSDLSFLPFSPFRDGDFYSCYAMSAPPSEFVSRSCLFQFHRLAEGGFCLKVDPTQSLSYSWCRWFKGWHWDFESDDIYMRFWTWVDAITSWDFWKWWDDVTLFCAEKDMTLQGQSRRSELNGDPLIPRIYKCYLI